MMKEKIMSLLLLGLVGCYTAQKSLEKKDYDKAYKAAIRGIKLNSNKEKNVEVLTLALEAILKEKEHQKEQLSHSAQLDDLEKMMAINDEQQRLVVKASPYTAGKFDEQDHHLLREMAQLKQDAAKGYFELGKSTLENANQTEDKWMARAAYTHFEKAKKYNSKEKAIDLLLQKSLESAQLIYHIEASAPFDPFYKVTIDAHLSRLENQSSNFEKIYFEKDPPNNNVDCAIEITFQSLGFNSDKKEDNKDFKAEIVTGTKTIIKSDGTKETVDVVEVVEARVITTKIVNTANWQINIQATSLTGNCRLENFSFYECLNTEKTKVVVEGDQRAITGIYSNQETGEEKDESTMAEELLDLIYTRVTQYLYH